MLQREHLRLFDVETRQMDEEIRQQILTLLDQHRIMTIATLRPDGWPQATTVGYANEGLTLAVPHAVVPSAPAEKLAGGCTRPTFASFCGSRCHYDRDGQ
jgi:hypothetical protein